MPVVGFGTAFWQLCGGEDQTPCLNEVEEEGWEHSACVGCVSEALEIGFRHFDLAEQYDGSEDAFRRALESKATHIRREDVFLTSKVMPASEGYSFYGTIESFNRSLERLNTNYLDMYLLHWAAPGWQLAWRALEVLHQEGRVHAIGVSNFDKSLLEEMLDDPSLKVPPAAVQNFVDARHQYKDLRAWCKSQGIVYIAYSSLTYFTNDRNGTYGDSRKVLQRIAKQHGVSTQHVILRWALQEGMVIIPKTRKRKHMMQNLHGLNFTLKAEEMFAIAALDRPEDKTLPSDECDMEGDLVTC